jgi:Protein of unknown function (DUF3891)
VVIREEAGGWIAIGQPAHAWVSGQLARAWGNERFAAPEPREEVCLAAEQHDLGMAAWDAAPALNPDTGRPRSFMELPPATHLELWTAAPVLARTQSRYAALLVSLHGETLFRMRDLDRQPRVVARAIRRYLEDQRAVQDALLTTLREDPHYARHATPVAVHRNRRLVAAWDGLSLALCMARYPWTQLDVPASGDDDDAELTVAGDGTRATVDPWPFAAERVRVRCDGRRLTETFDDEDAMRAALERAPWVTLEFELAPEPPVPDG